MIVRLTTLEVSGKLWAGTIKAKGGPNTMKHQTTSGTEPMPPLPQPSTPGSIDTATLELLASWRAQDATDNPDELRAAEQELAAFKKAMNENRENAGEPRLYS